MSVALLAISSFGTLIFLSFNTDPHVKFLIVIILVGIVVSAQNFVPSAAVMVGFHETLLQNSSILFFELLIGFCSC